MGFATREGIWPTGYITVYDGNLKDLEPLLINTKPLKVDVRFKRDGPLWPIKYDLAYDPKYEFMYKCHVPHFWLMSLQSERPLFAHAVQEEYFKDFNEVEGMILSKIEDSYSRSDNYVHQLFDSCGLDSIGQIILPKKLTTKQIADLVNVSLNAKDAVIRFGMFSNVPKSTYKEINKIAQMPNPNNKLPEDTGD